jgi:hypothetical protein
MDKLKCKYIVEIKKDYLKKDSKNSGIRLSKLYEVAYGEDEEPPVPDYLPDKYFPIYVYIGSSTVHDDVLNRTLDKLLFRGFDYQYGNFVGDIRITVSETFKLINYNEKVKEKVKIESYRAYIEAYWDYGDKYQAKLEIIGKNKNGEDVLIRLDADKRYSTLGYLESIDMDKAGKIECCGRAVLRNYGGEIADGYGYLDINMRKYNHERVESLSVEISSVWVGKRLRLWEFPYGLKRKIDIKEIEDRLIPPHKVDETEMNVPNIYIPEIYVDKLRMRLIYNKDKIAREDDVYVFYNLHNCRRWGVCI